MNQHTRIAVQRDDVSLWKQDGRPVPGWLHPWMVGRVEANGTFLIEMPLGQQRVHRGYVVVEQAGDVYAWPADEVDERVAELRERTAAASRPANMVGPGKSLKTAIPSRKRDRGVPDAARRAYSPVRGTPPSIEWVAVGDLTVDAEYQRSIDNYTSQRLIASIAAHWDWRLCMPLAVSRRDEGRYVIDGQHRLAAARLRTDIPHLPCCIANYAGAADEAAMFVAANRARRAISRLDDFHAALVAGDEDAIEVNRVVREAGLKVSRQTRSQAWLPGEVSFTSSIALVLGKHGEDLVLEALTGMADAFKGQVLSAGASVFVGLTRILVRPPERLDRERLYRARHSHNMIGWGRFVKGAKGTDMRAQASDANGDPRRLRSRPGIMTVPVGTLTDGRFYRDWRRTVVGFRAGAPLPRPRRTAWRFRSRSFHLAPNHATDASIGQSRLDQSIASDHRASRTEAFQVYLSSARTEGGLPPFRHARSIRAQDALSAALVRQKRCRPPQPDRGGQRLPS